MKYQGREGVVYGPQQKRRLSSYWCPGRNVGIHEGDAESWSIIIDQRFQTFIAGAPFQMFYILHTPLPNKVK